LPSAYLIKKIRSNKADLNLKTISNNA